MLFKRPSFISRQAESIELSFAPLCEPWGHTVTRCRSPDLRSEPTCRYKGGVGGSWMAVVLVLVRLDLLESSAATDTKPPSRNTAVHQLQASLTLTVQLDQLRRAD